MIPFAHIALWREHVPWQSNALVEQDLAISRALVEIFSDDFLRENLAFRGGTALHKLYIHPAPRYSEDIDLVQVKAGPIKPILNKLDERMTFIEEKRTVKQKAHNNTVLYRFISEDAPQVRLRLKLEINCREHFSVLGWKPFSFEVENPWFTGKAKVTTYSVEELLGTKLRALYQRRKGRDLFDLYYSGQHHKLDPGKIIKCYTEYMKFSVKKPPTQKQFLLNLEEKKSDAEFAGDLEGLLRPETAYDQDKAFDWVIENLISKLP